MDTQELKKILLEKGATFVGFSDIRDAENNMGFSGAITIGIKLLDALDSLYALIDPFDRLFVHSPV